LPEFSNSGSSSGKICRSSGSGTPAHSSSGDPGSSDAYGADILLSLPSDECSINEEDMSINDLVNIDFLGQITTPKQ
jgi:hypothetical protein